MRRIASLLINIGDHFMSLSDRTRSQLIVATLVLLGTGSIYKLVVNVGHLSDPPPPVTTDELIKPMEKLFKDQPTGSQINYRQARQREIHKLDSLAKLYSSQNPSAQ